MHYPIIICSGDYTRNDYWWKKAINRFYLHYISLYKMTNLDETGINAPAIHALWTMHGLKALNGTNQEALAVAMKALTIQQLVCAKQQYEVLPKQLQLLSWQCKKQDYLMIRI